MTTVRIAIAMLAIAAAIAGGCAQPSTRPPASTQLSAHPFSKGEALAFIPCAAIEAIGPSASGDREIDKGSTPRETALVRLRQDDGGYWTVAKDGARGAQAGERHHDCSGR